jgi:hypothetical protein
MSFYGVLQKIKKDYFHKKQNSRFLKFRKLKKNLQDVSVFLPRDALFHLREFSSVLQLVELPVYFKIS